jgi:ADP-ribosylglycohydrolase
MTRAGRIAGCLYGAAIGDALGSAFEFVDSDAIERALGEPIVRAYQAALPGSLLYPREPGRPTDDTAMALSVACAIAGGEPLTPALFARRFLEDLDRDSGRFGKIFWGGGPGGATTRSLSRLRRGADPATCGHPEDGGNGAAMRVHPVGFLADRNEVLDVAALQARVTHGHPAAVAAAVAVAALVHDALEDVATSVEVPAGISDPTFVKTWHELHRGLVPDGLRLPSRLRNVAMSGWETVAAAHAIATCFADDPVVAIGVAAASGGDTDTLASITGAIVGARSGVRAFPKAWLEGLNARHIVEDVLREILASTNCGALNERA